MHVQKKLTNNKTKRFLKNPKPQVSTELIQCTKSPLQHRIVKKGIFRLQ